MEILDAFTTIELWLGLSLGALLSDVVKTILSVVLHRASGVREGSSSSDGK